MRNRILAEASRIHERQGEDGVSMRALAARVGVTATAIYRHFRDKNALMAAIVDAGFVTLLEHLRRPRRTRPVLLGIMDNFLDFALEQPRLYELMFLRRREDVRRFPADFAAHKSPTFDLLVDAVVREMDGGTLRKDDPLETALTVWTHAHGLISMYTLGRFGRDAVSFRRTYRRSMLRLYDGLAQRRSR